MATVKHLHLKLNNCDDFPHNERVGFCRLCKQRDLIANLDFGKRPVRRGKELVGNSNETPAMNELGLNGNAFADRFLFGTHIGIPMSK